MLVMSETALRSLSAHREVGGVAIDPPGARIVQGARGVDEGAAAGDIGIRRHPLHRRLAKARVGHMALGIREGDLQRLQDKVRGGRLVARERRREVMALKDAQGLQYDDALAVGRQFQHRVIAVRGADGLDPLGLNGVEIDSLEEAAA